MNPDDLAKSLFSEMCVEQIPVGAYLVSPDGRFLAWNKIIQQMFCAQHADLAAARITDFYIDRDVRRRLLCKLGAAEQRGYWLIDEILALRVGDQIRYVRDYCKSVRHPQSNAVIGYVGCLVDVTDEGVYNLLSKKLGIAIFAVDLSDRMLFVNDSMVSMFGYPDQATMLSMTVQGLFEDEKAATELKAQVTKEREVPEFVTQMQSLDGTRWVGSITAALDSTETHYACRVSDVTMDRQYRQMLEEMPVGTFMYREKDSDHVLVRCNDHYAGMLGFRHKESIIGKPIGFTHSDCSRLSDYLAQLDKDGRVEGIDVHLCTTRGKQLDAKVWATKLSGVGQISGRVGAIIDVGEEKKLVKRIAELTQNIGQILHTYSQTLYTIRLKTTSVLKSLQPDPFSGGELPESDQVEAELSGPVRALCSSLSKLARLASESGSGPPALKARSARLFELDDKLRASQSSGRIDPSISFITADVMQICDELLKCEVPRVLVKRVRDEAGDLLRLNAAVSAHYIVDRIAELDHEIASMRDYVTEGIRHHEKPEACSLPQLVKEAISNMIDYAQNRGIEIRISDSTSGCMVTGVARNLVRAISNVLHNAIKYSWTKIYGGTAWVQIQVREQDGTASVSIENHGVAIPQIEIDSRLIFRLGFRGRLSQDRGRVGTGIGLADAWQVMKASGGEIEIVSTPAREGVAMTDFHRPFKTTVTLKFTKRREA